MDGNKIIRVKIISSILIIIPLIFLTVLPVFADPGTDPMPPSGTYTPTVVGTTMSTLLPPCPVSTYDANQTLGIDYAMRCSHCMPTPTPFFGIGQIIPIYDSAEFYTATPGPTPTANGFVGGGGPGDKTSTPGLTITPGGPTATITLTPTSQSTPGPNGSIGGPCYSWNKDYYYNVKETDLTAGSYSWSAPVGNWLSGRKSMFWQWYAPLDMSEGACFDITYSLTGGSPNGYLDNRKIEVYLLNENYGTINVRGGNLTYGPNGGGQFCWPQDSPEQPTYIKVHLYFESGSTRNVTFNMGTLIVTGSYRDGFCPLQEPTQTPTPTPIINLDDSCSEWEYTDGAQAVEWGDFVIDEEQVCRNLIPVINLRLGIVERVIGHDILIDYPGLTVCMNSVTFPKIALMGIEFPTDLFVVPFVAWLIRVLMRL